VPIPASARASTIGHLLSLLRAVTAVDPRRVPRNLASDRAAMAPQLPGDLSVREPLRSKRGKHISLTRGDLAIRHWRRPLLGGGETSPVSSDRLPHFGGLVAVTL